MISQLNSESYFLKSKKWILHQDIRLQSAIVNIKGRANRLCLRILVSPSGQNPLLFQAAEDLQGILS